MHYTCEVVVPPFDDKDELNKFISEILKKYEEGYKDEYGYSYNHSFYDYFVIGGRFSGRKQKTMLDDEKLDKFYEELKNRGVTQSSVVFGKPTISPSSQIPMVDALWHEYFPEWQGKHCPVFQHSGDEDNLDIMTLGEFKKHTELREMESSTVAIGFLGYGEDADDDSVGTPNLYTLLHTSIWNGTNIQDTTFSGKVLEAIDLHNTNLSRAYSWYREQATPTDDWLVVTLDYHS